jgi:hypothetical protein
MKLMRAPNLIIGQHWVNVLEAAGIACELHNRYLNGALGRYSSGSVRAGIMAGR